MEKEQRKDVTNKGGNIMGFGKQLGLVLKELNTSVSELSKKTDIAPSTIYSIIDRDTKNVGINTVKKIEKALDLVPGDSIYNLLYDINMVENNQNGSRATKIQELIELVERIPDKRLDSLIYYATQYQEGERLND